MTDEYGPWTEYTGEDLGDALVQVQMRCQSREDAEKIEPYKACGWGWGERGVHTIHAYRKVLEPRVVNKTMHRRHGVFFHGIGYNADDESFKLNFPSTQSGKLDFSRQPTWEKVG